MKEEKVLFDHFDNNICHALRMIISFNHNEMLDYSK